MNYQETLSYLYALGNEVLAMKLGLDRVERLLQELGNPHQAIPSVLVAGTNGKGSTCAMLARILRQAGLKVGLYTSPHLLNIEERIQINGEFIAAEEFAWSLSHVHAAVERLLVSGELPGRPSFFEHITAGAFFYFRQRQPDILVLEVGMGGRLDATNVVTPKISVIANISLDHQEYLGNTLTEIAGEKAGIIKPGGFALIAGTQPAEAAQALYRHAVAMRARAAWIQPLAVCGRHESGKILVEVGGQPVPIPYRSAVQAQNAALAVAAARCLLPAGETTEAHIRQGLEQANWPGRTQWIAGAPPLLIDGAHNPSGVQALADCFRYDIATRPITLIFSAVKDKPARELLAPLLPFVAQVVICPIAGNPRSQSLSELAAVASHLWLPQRVHPVTDFAAALEKAKVLTPPSGLIVVAGSLYLVGEALGVLHLFAEQAVNVSVETN